ncbi:hypothetical protein ACFOY2_02620 [Nonomuraea purpurea]|uniref:Uncharacterized protein n=1 Tax=Nonomuraea purpurea TaxID=1849276 RepID=A0ABV8G0P6_9ACTN
MPSRLSRAVARAANATAVEVAGAGQIDLVMLNGDEVVGAVVELARRISGSRWASRLPPAAPRQNCDHELTRCQPLHT